MKLTAQERKKRASATMVGTLGLMLGGCALLALFALTAAASQPAWWTSRGAVNASLGTNDYAAVNQGQVKQFTARAADELNADLTNNGGAGAALTNLVYGWQQDYATHGYNATNLEPSDFNVMNVGQLKYIASLVYGQLSSAGYTGLYPSWLQVNTNTDNVAANVGQLKEVFNFDLSVAPAMVTGVTASASDAGEIDLSWTLPVLNNATSLTIMESTDGGTTWTTAETLTDPTLSSYAMTGLSQGSSYQFEVIAGNSAGSSSASTPTTATMAPVTPRYAVIDLGTNFTPVAINSSGMIAGNTSLGAAMVWSQGVTNTLLPSSYGSGKVSALNDAGQMAGQTFFDYLKPTSDLNPSDPASVKELHACLWTGTNSAPIDLDAQYNDSGGGVHSAFYPDGGYYSYGAGITAGGTVYGVTAPYGGYTFAVVFSTNADPSPANSNLNPNVYGAGADGPESLATGAAGSHWCGWGMSDTFPLTNFLLIDSQVITLSSSTYYGGTLAVNTNGVTAGTEVTSSGVLQPILIPGGGTTITNLPGTGYAEAINDATTTTVTGGTTNVVATPQIVGMDATGTNAMLWDQTYYDGTPSTNTANGGYVAKNLNLLIPGASGTNTPPWQITSAVGINNGGAIVGSAIKTATGTTNGVMLVPASITRDGLPINSTNNTVCVGQQINLTNVISGVPTNSITSYQWTIPGATNGTAFYDYEPSATSSNYTNLYTPTNYTTNNYCNFYTAIPQDEVKSA